MKFIQAFLSAVVCGLFFMVAVNAPAQSDKPGYATVVRIVGQARYSADNGTTWHPLVVGQTLGAGHLIQTAVKSTVDLVLGDKIPHQIDPNPDKVAPAADPLVRGMTSYKATAAQNVIRMQPDTVLGVDQLMISNTGIDAVSNTQLDLRQGTIFGNVKKLSAASQYYIKIPTGIAAIRGTTFVVSSDGTFTVVQGSAVLSMYINGQTVTQVLGPGDRYDPSTGQVTHLTPQQLAAARRTAAFTITIVEGIISFADDTTRIYVSPTRGRPSGIPPGPPPGIPPGPPD